MKRKILIIFLIIVILIIMLFKSNLNISRNAYLCSKVIEDNNKTLEYKRVVFLDNSNRLSKYAFETIYKIHNKEYYNRMCTILKSDTLIKNSNYDYLEAFLECRDKSMVIKSTVVYDVSLFNSKDEVDFRDIRVRLNDKFVFDLNRYIKKSKKQGFRCG